MLKFLSQRLLALIPVLGIVAVVVFLILRLTPGDPAALIAGNSATSDDIERIGQQLGLNEPLMSQFGIWIWHVLQGDLGYSFYMNKSVTSLISDRLEPTLVLAFGTMLISILVAVPLGLLAAWRMGGRLDRVLSGFTVAGFSIPVFVTAYILIYIFSIKLQWLPVQGYKRLSDVDITLWGWLGHMLLPWLTLSTIFIALLARVTRASVSEALTEDYIRTARAKGLSESAVLLRHALPNAAIPIVTVIGISAAILIGTVVVTETVYAIPGLGSLTVDAVLNRDFPVIQGLVLFFSVLYVLINLLVDISYLWLDPRIRY
jgi:peptide/nickel transport system permease protein